MHINMHAHALESVTSRIVSSKVGTAHEPVALQRAVYPLMHFPVTF
jgi:hypothetical protein